MMAGPPWENWIVEPDSKTVMANVLENGKYVVNAYGENDTVPSAVLEGCEVILKDVFADTNNSAEA
ncbi:MAG: hypothetical protein FWF08_09775 [Oscillospiraceae bacterium]|nr:hypothetical protein [Oscillospiraceae bacterium]